MRWPWSKSEPHIRFKSFSGDYSIQTPVVSAGRITPDWMSKQTDKKMSVCPGMFDYFRAGYIITAHVDIHIRANKEGTVVRLDGLNCDHERMQASHFDPAIAEGVARIDDTVKKVAMKIPLPWAIFTQKGYSIYALPAILHSPFLDKLFIYPGTIDAEDFHTMNFVFSPLTACEIVIPAGTPLLQIIPFKCEPITAECGKATEHERDRHTFQIASRAIKSYYRRFLSKHKSFAMSCPYDHRGS